MSIFEDKKHNDPAYIGQKPVMVPMTPADLRDATWGLINHAVEQPIGVRNLPPRDTR